MRQRDDDGFTLLEALVALAIAALTSAAIFSSLSMSSRAVFETEQAAVAISVARARLAAIGVEGPLVIGQSAGETPEGVRWSATITPRVRADLDPVSEAPSAFWVTVSVSWRDGLQRSHTRQLTTLKPARSG